MAAWNLVKLSEVCEIQRGGSPRPIDKFITDDENGINWIKIGDVAEGAKYITETREKIKPEGVRSSREVGYGDFLLSNSMSFGRPYILHTSGCIHDGWLVLRYDKDQLTEDFLYHVLSSDFVYAQFTKLAVGAVVKNLNSEVVRQVSIPLPPLTEQRRIAAILDQADALRTKRREALAQLDSFTQSIFIEMFGDPIENPNSFPVSNLIDLVDPERPISYGILMPGPEVEEGVSYVRVVDMKNGGIDLSGIRKTTQEISNSYKRSLLKTGDLLMSIRGHVGRLAVIPEELNGANITQDSARLAVIGANPIYVRECLRATGFQRWMVKHTKGVAVRGINLGDVKLMPISLPSRELQEKFAARVLQVEKLQAISRDSLTNSTNLFLSLQHRAFRGEL